MRLDLAVARQLGLSRRAAREAVRGGRIDVDGATADEPGAEVGPAARIEHHPNRPARHRVRSRLMVLHEDADVLIVEKPAGLLTVPTAERERDTLLARVLEYLQHRYRRRPYAGIVHRLDKDTSGAIVFARNRETLHALQDLFRAHDIEREYLAIVRGAPPEAGVLDADLVRDAGLGRRGVARGGQAGRRAVTRYRVIERLADAALVSVTLETGRTHQIRIHFAAAGTPVVGDRVYGSRERNSRAGPPDEPTRQMLHARRLGFVHPATGEALSVTSNPPPDFEGVLDTLRRGRASGRVGPPQAKAEARVEAKRRSPAGAGPLRRENPTREKTGRGRPRRAR